MEESLQRWRSAVVHLETAADSGNPEGRFQRSLELQHEAAEGLISPEEAMESMLHGVRDLRKRGTALFLRHQERRYLLTARHILHDKLGAERDLRKELKRVASAPPNSASTLGQEAARRAENRIYDIVFRVPTLDEALHSDVGNLRGFLMNLGAGASDSAPYTFSDADRDLAIISLDQRNGEFADELQAAGYQPVCLDDLTGGLPPEGTEVFTVGFPGATATLPETLPTHPAVAPWSSSAISLPTFAFGKVAMQHEALYYFWCDMSIYPGNSGGPVVADDMLVGVVSRQARVEGTRIPFGMVIKAALIRPLLDEQLTKDERYSA